MIAARGHSVVSPTRILGIDPGSQRTGVGIVDVAADGRLQHVHHETVVLVEAETFALRLKMLFERLSAVVEAWQPREVAIERVFMARNPDSALKLGQARGAALCALVTRELEVHEYAAREVKQSIVGTGAADKSQIQHMVGVLLSLQGRIQADAADALALALTHAHMRASPIPVALLRSRRRR